MTKPFEEWVEIVNPTTLNELKQDSSFKFCKQNIYKRFGISQKMLQKTIEYFNYEIIPLTKSKPLTTEEWVEKASLKHNGFYDYSLAIYINNNSKIKIICPIHAVFEQTPSSHSDRGDNCPKCGLESRASLNRTSKEDFINKSNQVHKYKFDYSLIEDFKRLESHLTIICPIHGIFKQNGHSHIRGADCEKCSYEKRGVDYSISKEEMLNRFNNFNNGLIYDLSDYRNSNSIIKYTYLTHGIITQNASKHLRGGNCSKCAKKGSWNTGTTEKFIEKAKQVHGDYYDYSSVEYFTNRKKVKIICKHHGSFLQAPNTHVENLAGCPTCAIITSNIRDYITVEETKNIPCALYIMKLENKEEFFYKIGISRNVNKRIKGIHYDSDKLYNVSLVYTLNTSLFMAATLEQELHKKHKNLKYLPKIYFKGHTECFNTSLPTQDIIKYLTSL